MRKFPFDPPPLDVFLDVEGVARGDDEQVRAAVGEFAGRFPQIRVAICLLRLSPGTSLSEFGHWMINASPLAEGETPVDRRRTLLLVMDLNSSRASLTLGYDVEALLGETSARAALASVAPEFAAGRFGLGVRLLLGAIGSVLDEVSSRLAERGVSG